MKILKLLIIPLLVVGISNKSFSQDTIHWSPCYKLKFVDFKGKPDSTKIDLANSYIQIDYTYNTVNGQLQFNVNCYFLKEISWSKHDMATLLEHEQIHFDIAKFFALKLEQQFKEYKLTPYIALDLRAIYDKIVMERLIMDNLFDKVIKDATNDTPQKKFMGDIRMKVPSCKNGMKSSKTTSSHTYN